MGKIKRGPHNLFVTYETGEVDFRNNYFKDVNDLYKYKDQWKCSICSCNLEKSILQGEFCKHPALGVLVCPRCLEYYGDGLFSPDEYGEDKFCRWCAQGGNLYCCSSCVCTFCKKCIQRHFKENRKVMKSLDSEDWKCFLCKSKPIWFLRALCWAVYKFKNDFVKEEDRSRSRANRSKRSRSSSSNSDEDTFTKKNRHKAAVGENSNNRTGKSAKAGPKSRTCRNERIKEDSSDDELEVIKKPRSSRSKSKLGKTNSSDNEEEEEDRKTNNGKKKMGPKSKKGKDTSDEEENDKERQKRTRTKCGPKSKKEKKHNSDEEESDKCEKRTRTKIGPKSKKERKDTSDEEESEKCEKRTRTKIGPKSKKEKKDNSDEESDEECEKRTRTKIGPKSKKERKDTSDEEESEKCEKRTRTKIGPKSKKEKKDNSDEESDEECEKRTKTKIGPKSKKERKDTSDEEESEKCEKRTRTKIGPKSKKEKKDNSDEESDEECEKRTRTKIGPKSKKEREVTSDEEKQTKIKIGPKSKVSELSEKKIESSEDEAGAKVKKLFGPKSKRTIVDTEKNAKEDSAMLSTSRRTRKINDPNECEQETAKKRKQDESHEDSKSNGNDESLVNPAETAANMFQHTLTLCESLALDIQKKTDKLKKYSTSTKFSSANNTRKIFSLLFDEMKKNSMLFSSLGEVVESHINCVQPLFSGKGGKNYDPPTTDIYNETTLMKDTSIYDQSTLMKDTSIYDQSTLMKDTSIYDQSTLMKDLIFDQSIINKDDVEMEVAETSKTTEKNKKRGSEDENMEEDAQNEKEVVGANSILHSDEDDNASPIKDRANKDETSKNNGRDKKTTEKTKDEGASLVLTSDENDDESVQNDLSNNAEVSKTNLRDKKTTKKTKSKDEGASLVLTSDENDDESVQNDLSNNNAEVSKTNTRDKRKNDKIQPKDKIGENNQREKDECEKKINDASSILTSDEEAETMGNIKHGSNVKPEKLSEALNRIPTSDSDIADVTENGKKLDEEVSEPTDVHDILKSSDSDVDMSARKKEKSFKSKSAKKNDCDIGNDSQQAELESIFSSDNDEKLDLPEVEPAAEGLNSILASSDEDDKTANFETEYFTPKSGSDVDTTVEKVKKSKTKGRSSCKEDKLSGREEKTDDDDDDSDRDETDKDKSKKKRDSITRLTKLSPLDETPVSKRISNVENPDDSTSKKTPKSSTRKKKSNGYTNLLSFLNGADCSSGDELAESTELLSNLIKAKSEEAKRQNEEMIKQGLLRADDESNKEESDDDVLSDDEKKPKKTKGKVKEEKKSDSSEEDKKDTKKKIKEEKKLDSSEEDKKDTKKKINKEPWKNDSLLTGKLTDTDESEAEAKLKSKKKAQDLITLSSDDELITKKRKKRNESSDDSDCFVVKKKVNKRKARLRDSSDSSDVQVISSSEDTEEISSDDDFKKKSTKKRSRIKKIKDSDEEKSDDDDEENLNASQGTPGKGRKNIRHIMTNEELAKETINASKAESDRKKRIEERQALYNKLFKIRENINEHEPLTKLVLDFNEKTKTELISVHPDLVCKLKPHQVEGVRFMFNACFESVQQIKKNKAGSGAILAHCMGLGKTLQVVTLVHTLMMHRDLTKVNRVMVVTPLNTVSNWVDEFHNWLKNINNGDDCETFNLIKSKKDYERSYTLNCWFEEGGVLIIGYEMFRNLINKRGLSKKVKTTVLKTLLDPGPDLVVCDEGHILKNEASAVSKAMCQIKTLRRIILTGTPLQNNLEEYHCMVQFIKPNLLGDRKEFKNRFAHPINNGQYIDSTPRDVKIMKRRAHVLYKMLDGIVQRRDYNVLTPFLPPKFEYVISIKLTDLQIKLYRHYLDNLTGESADGKHRLFADYQALKLVWTHPWTLKSASVAKKKRDDAKENSDSEGSLRDFIDDDGDDEEEESKSESGSNSDPPAKKSRVRVTRGAKSRGEVLSEDEGPKVEAAPSFWWSNLVTEEDIENISNSNKLLAFMFVLKQCEEIGDKLLVFSQSLETLSMLEYFLNKIDECSQDGTLDANLSQFQATWNLGSDYFRLDGSSSSEDRSYWVKSFNNPSNLRARLFLISTKAGGLGINLVAANRVIIFDVSWNPSHDIQSIFRVFRFGQKKPCYIYRFLAQGTMEEKIYDRQVAKQSMSCRVVDEQQIDRHFTRSDISELYEFKPDEKKDRKTPALPKDRLMAEMIKEMNTKIVAFHEHDSLLENVQDEELNEDERQAAWEEYESEKSRPAINAGLSYVNNLIMQNTMRQQQQGLLAPGTSADISKLKIDNTAMLNHLKSSNPDVEESALINIVNQSAQRLEDYKNRQQMQFNSMINNMHQSMQQSYANQMMNKNLQGGIAAGLMNRMSGAPLGAMYNPRFNVPRPNVMRQGSRGPSGVDMMRRMNPVARSTPKPPPRPPQPRYGPGSSSNTPIEI